VAVLSRPAAGDVRGDRASLGGVEPRRREPGYPLPAACSNTCVRSRCVVVAAVLVVRAASPRARCGGHAGNRVRQLLSCSRAHDAGQLVGVLCGTLRRSEQTATDACVVCIVPSWVIGDGAVAVGRPPGGPSGRPVAVLALRPRVADLPRVQLHASPPLPPSWMAARRCGGGVRHPSGAPRRAQSAVRHLHRTVWRESGAGTASARCGATRARSIRP
jgi:hypothetical protein